MILSDKKKMRGILKKIIYRGCLKDLCFYVGGMFILLMPIWAKFIADYIIYIEGI